MAEKIAARYNDEKRYRAMYYALFFPVFFGGLAFAGSGLSPVFGWTWGIAIGCVGIWTVASYLNKKHVDSKWRPLYFVVNLDLGALFGLCPLWIVLGEPVWLGLVLLLLVGICVFMTHRYRKVVATGIFLEGGTKGKQFGKWYFGTVALIEVLTAGGSYGYARFLQVITNYSTAQVVLASCMAPVMLMIVMFAHSGYIKATDPDWKSYAKG